MYVSHIDVNFGAIAWLPKTVWPGGHVFGYNGNGGIYRLNYA